MSIVVRLGRFGWVLGGLGLLLVVATMFATVEAIAADTTPLTVNFQGRLTDANGVPVNGPRNMFFRYYDDAASPPGVLLYAESRTDVNSNAVTVTQGNYAVALGGGTRFDGSEAVFQAVFANHSAVWLELQVAGELAMTPRIRILAAGYAINADLLDGQDGTFYRNAANVDAGTLNAARLPADGYAATYVNVTGDTMTGALQIDTSSGLGLKLNAPANGNVDLNFQSAESGTAHWAFSKRGSVENHALSLYKDGGGTPATTWNKDGTVVMPFGHKADYDSGWFAVQSNTDNTILLNHNLGVVPTRYTLHFSTDNPPSGWIYDMTGQTWYDAGHPYNSALHSGSVRFSTTQMDIPMWSGGYVGRYYSLATDWLRWKTGFYRVYAWK